jgi:hypothetical protein
MDWDRFCYFPVLKTKDAELRAIKSVDSVTRKKILPIYELTKSRITKKNTVGDIAKRMEQISEIQKGAPFILDVTTDVKQTNQQISNILLSDGGYEYWQALLGAYAGLNIIPAIHINQETDEELISTMAFVRAMAGKYPRMALRLPPGLDAPEYLQIIDSIVSELGDSKLYVLLDGECIRSAVKQSSIEAVADNYLKACKSIIAIDNSDSWLERIVCIAGSFPALVAQEGGGDSHGSFDIHEHSLYLALRGYSPDLRFGDYASININQIEMRGGTFIPRIDFCTEQTFFYHRFRRENGSYTQCAKMVLLDKNYLNSSTWGGDEIASAAMGSPSGISPSFWISVRANNYMSMRVRILSF